MSRVARPTIPLSHEGDNFPRRTLHVIELSPNAQRFHNDLRILLNIELSDLEAAGINMDHSRWVSFMTDPYRWAIRASDEDYAKLWAIIETRQPNNTP